MAEEHDKETRGLLGFVTNHSEAFVSVAALAIVVVIPMEQTKVMREEAELERRNVRNGVSVCYCSVYGDCFRTELFRRPRQVEACAAAEQPFVSHGFFRN
jgi:hypothetical protein